jgi:uncharacterized protein YtpQ (UPF0354 family)
MKTIIHVNQHNIRSNLKAEKKGIKDRLPVITCKTYKDNQYANEVIIYDELGNEAARVIYSPDNPLGCGAKVWIETNNKIKIKK